VPSFRRFDVTPALQIKVLQFGAPILAAIAFAAGVNLAPFVALVAIFFLFLVFYLSKSVVNGLYNLFLSAAITSVICSISHELSIELRATNSVMPIFVFCCALLVFLNRKILATQLLSWLQFEFCLVWVLLLTAVFLRQFTYLNGTDMFAMLIPEDNASWIGASNGFLRFNATVGEVASMENGTKYFLASLLSIISEITSFANLNGRPEVSLISVANTYSLLILMLMAFSSAMAFHVFHTSRLNTAGPKFFSSGKYALIGLIVAVSVSKVFLNAGHLSLICGAFVLCAASFGFKNTVTSNNSLGGIDTFWKLNIVFLSSYAIGNAWLPLLPIALATLFLGLLFAIVGKVFMPVPTKGEGPNLTYILNLLFALFIALAEFYTLRIPSGYSISNLILNNPGGTIVPTTITLSLSILGFVSFANTVGTNNFNTFLMPLLPLALLAFWLFTLNSLPEQPGYSVEKFSMLIAVIGLPYFAGSLMSLYESHTKNQVSQYLNPILLIFTVLLSSWGVNSFPRISLLNESNKSISYLPSLLEQSWTYPNAHILCLGTTAEYDLAAYNCSRFGSALQFREFGTDDLSRRWRSQLLGFNVDPKRILEDENFLGDDLINKFLDSGGKLIVILIPGPYESWMNDREDQPWIQELPWNRVSVTQ
jgi:hypothetical protein